MKTIVSVLLLLLSFCSSYACDCNTISGLKECDVAFSGKVLSIQRVDSIIIYYEITFKVDTVFKGKITSKNVAIIMPCLQDGCCGILMHINDKFAVFAFNEDMGYSIGKRLQTNQCWETQKIK